MRAKQLARTTITGGVACALLLGSFTAGSFSKPAFAAEVVQGTAASSTSPIIVNHMNSIVRDTAWIADKDESDIYAALANGQSLVQASGLKADDLAQRLIGLFNESINQYFEDSDVSSADVQALRNQGASQLTAIISVKGYKPAVTELSVNLKKVIQEQLRQVISNVALYADQDVSDMEQRVLAGETLVQVSGLVKSDLLSKLTTQLDQAIDQAVNQQHISASKVQAAKEEGASQLAAAISTAGYRPSGQTAQADVTSAVYTRIDNLISDVSVIADKDYIDVTDVLQNGGTLVQASGLPEGDLYNSLAKLMDDSINQEASKVMINSDELSQVREKAYNQLRTVINQPGYNGKSGEQAASIYEAQVQDRLNLVVSEAASLADRDIYDVQDLLNQGSNLAEATGLSASELASKLTASVNQYMDGMSNDNVNAEVQSKARQDAATYIRTLVQSGLVK